MDIKSPQKKSGGKFPKPSVVSPVKDHGKVSLGFRGFKIINSNIRIVKQTDVRVPVSKPKTSSEVTSLPPNNPQKKLSMAESLKQIRDRVLQKKKLHEELSAVDLEKQTVEKTPEVIPNGICARSVVGSPVENSASRNSPPKVLENAEVKQVVDDDLNCHSPPAQEKKTVPVTPEKCPSDIGSPDNKKGRLKKRHSPEGTDKKSRSETSSSSRSRSHKHDPSYRKNRERSRSPHHVRDHRHTKANFHNSSSERRARSLYHDKESYSSNRGNSSRRSSQSHHSRRREPMYVRKYSASHDSRNAESSKSHLHSRSHHSHSEKRKSHGEDDYHRRRTSNHHQSRSADRSSSSRGKGTTESRVVSTSHKEKTKSAHKHLPDEQIKQAEERTNHSSGNRKHGSTDGLFSKLSFALLNEDEEQFEGEMENSPQRNKSNESEAIDTDIESFHTINEAESSEVDTACEDELPACKVIDEVETDHADSSSFGPDENDVRLQNDSDEDDARSENVSSPEQDAAVDAVNVNSPKNDSLCDINSFESIEYSCFDPLSNRAELRKVFKVIDCHAESTTASVEMKHNISCDTMETQGATGVSECEVQQKAYSSEKAAEDVSGSSCKSGFQIGYGAAIEEDGMVEPLPPLSLTVASDDKNTSNHTSTVERDKYAESNIDEEASHLFQTSKGTVPGNAEYHSSQSDKSASNLTLSPKENLAKSEHQLVSFSLVAAEKLGIEKVLTPGNKIHTVTSKLKNVFESLLRTDFEADSEPKIDSVSKLNGVIPQSKLKSSENSKVEESGEPFGVAGSAESAEEGFAVASLTEAPAVMSDAGKDVNAEEGRRNHVVVTQNDDDITLVPIPPLAQNDTSAVNISPEKGTKASPYKLKLHATTRTPLPAKKSYIQQVQSGRRDPRTACSSLLRRATNASDTEAGAVSSDAEMHEIKPATGATSHASENSEVEANRHCEGIFVVESQSACFPSIADSALMHQDSSGSIADPTLARQDSSGSSANDNEEGPRRSARIRTKRSGGSLKKQISFENSGQNLPVINNTSETVQFDESAIESEGNAAERTLEHLSGEELFKAKINVAQDVTECPETFELLEENLYLTSMKKSRARKEIRRMVCDCALEDSSDPGEPCGENCLNRLLMIECSSRCHYGDRCTNKRFQQRRYAPTEVFKTSFKGWGIRAAADIEPGQLVMEYCGEVVDQREFTRRSLEYSKSNHAHFYFMALSQDEVIDATFKGNSSRFINHSCDPNAETQKWTVNGRLRVGFFTLRRIGKGEEITFDYQFERYGKVAQKCFCGTKKCRGYLGKAPDENGENDSKVSRLLSNEALSPSDGLLEDNSMEKAQQKKKKLAYFTDDTMEKDLSKLLGGLRSSKEVLTLSRLMVRCDTHMQRIMCLRVLKETTSQTRLKTFLQFHGLSIIWSWMVDIGSVEDADSVALKLDIINTLCMLPITNKNVIEDSKVLSVVQRWAKPETRDKVSSQGEGSPKEEEGMAKESRSEDIPPVQKAEEKNDSEELDPKVTIKPPENGETIEGEVSKEPSQEEEEPNLNEASLEQLKTDDELIKTNESVLAAAASLLLSWKDLKEIYRIPKRQKPLPSPSRDSSSRDNSVSRNSSPLAKQNRNDDFEQRSNRIGHLRRGSSQERWRESSDRIWDYKHRDKRTDYPENQFSPGSSNSSENKKEVGRRKRRFSTDSDDFSKDLPWHSRAPRNSIKMSRQEHRRRFEKDVEKREQEKKRMEEQMEAEMAQNAMFPIQGQQYISGMPEEIQPLLSQDLSMVGQAMPGGATFTPSGFSGNLIQINPTQPATLMVDPYLNVAAGQHVNVIPQVIQQTQNPYSVQVQVQNYDVSEMYNQDPNLQPGVYGINDPNMVAQQQMSHAGQQIFTSNSINMPQTQLQQQQNAINIVQPQLQHQNSINILQTQQPQEPSLIQSQQQGSNKFTILGSRNGQAIVLLSAEQLQKLTEGDLSALKESAQDQNNDAKNPSERKQQGTTDTSKRSEKKDKFPTKLPPNWKTATDPEGRVYYYHVITRQTQWDPPTWDGKEEDLVGKKEAEMDLSSTPTHDERGAKSSKSENDGVTDEGRKAKETFRLRMSQFVVQCLRSYRKPNKKAGRITSTEDFKHLARKLTHNLMEKELKQVRVLEDLDFNANVKHKTKEYVKKYMSKVGPVYKIKDYT